MRESQQEGGEPSAKPRRPSATSLELFDRPSPSRPARAAQAAEADATGNRVAGKPIGKIAAADPLLRGDAGPPARRTVTAKNPPRSPRYVSSW